jgi:4a-hydroxytetrahydrobiopterin dehydratase
VPKNLSKVQIDELLAEYPNWTFADDALHAEFKFKNFIQAFGFLSQLAILQEKQNHHALIENMYNKVILTLTTHDAGNKITERDVKLITAIEKVLLG